MLTPLLLMNHEETEAGIFFFCFLGIRGIKVEKKNLSSMPWDCAMNFHNLEGGPALEAGPYGLTVESLFPASNKRFSGSKLIRKVPGECQTVH